MGLYIITALSLFLAVSLAQQVNNSTEGKCPIEIPGFFHHGDCQVFCRQTSWSNIIVFFLGNYVAHVATSVSEPGQSPMTTVFRSIAALFFPGSGAVAGWQAVCSLAIFAPTDLQMAARAGALCAVVKDDPESDIPRWRSPMPSMEPGPPVMRKGPWKSCATRVHGLVQLPRGYSLRVLHKGATFLNDEAPPSRTLWGWLSSFFRPEDEPRTVAVCCSYNVFKVIFSLGQLSFAVATLYRARGDQIDRYGYAAFGLTVVPYAWMSFVNLVGNFICPQYPSVFLVESAGLDELRSEPGYGDQFKASGTLSRLTPDADSILSQHHKAGSGRTTNFYIYSALLIASAPIAIVGGLSHFAEAQSTYDQRSSVMSWLIFGIVVGYLIPELIDRRVEPRASDVLLRRPRPHSRTCRAVFWYSVLLAFLTAAVFGFVTVSSMLREFGSCLEL